METAEKLLNDVKSIIKINEEEINKTGKGFNLISLLGMENNERYCHSNIIAELLNHKGSHTFGNQFFKLFLDQVGINDFSTFDYEVLTEEYVGEIECTDGEKLRTFLDIVIKDKTNGNVILIENKIWAVDQHYQIERYYDKYKSKIVKLFYLNVNLWNECPTEREEIHKVFQNISYRNEIKNWLLDCLKETPLKPFVQNQIEAYYEIVLKISKLNNYKKMDDELKNTILLDKDNLKSYFKLLSLQDEIKFEITKKFMENILSVNLPIDKNNYGAKNTSFTLYNKNGIEIFLEFESKFSNFFLGITSLVNINISKLEVITKYNFIIKNENYIWKFVSQYNNVSFENLLDKENIDQVKEIIEELKIELDKF
jgi:hypothetical protein